MQNFTRKKQAVSHSLNTREEKQCLNLDCYISMGCCRQLLLWRIHFHYKSAVQYFYALNHICLQIKKYWLTPNLEVSSQSCRKKPLIGWIEEILSPASWLWCSGSPQALGNLSVLGGRTFPGLLSWRVEFPWRAQRTPFHPEGLFHWVRKQRHQRRGNLQTRQTRIPVWSEHQSCDHSPWKICPGPSPCNPEADSRCRFCSPSTSWHRSSSLL